MNARGPSSDKFYSKDGFDNNISSDNVMDIIDSKINNLNLSDRNK